MRLINTHTGQMREYQGKDRPRYVTVSHRWTDDEITFKDYVKGRRKECTGYKKIQDLSQVAKARGIDHVWIDTACIDKRSSAELSEAINSMYGWYAEADECYAYLADLECATGEDFLQQFGRSAWFTRGWTLQELIAPKLVRFFDSGCNQLGVCGQRALTHASHNFDLAETISEITSIPAPVLRWEERPQYYSIAQRLSWLGNRMTTREEDMAYCVLGLLGINMPLLYGEGDSAWSRLQEEIIRVSHDETIFTWPDETFDNYAYTFAKPPGADGSERKSSAQIWKVTPTFVPLLAPKPHYFESCGDRKIMVGSRSRPPYTITNQGLELRLLAFNGIWMGNFRCNDRKATLIRLSLNARRHSSRGNCEILLLQQPCGHYDRVITGQAPESLRNAASQLSEFAYDRTIHIHTDWRMQEACQLNWRESYHLTAV